MGGFLHPNAEGFLKPFIVHCLHKTLVACLDHRVVGSGPVSPWSLDEGVPGVGPPHVSPGFCSRLLQCNRFRLKLKML